MRRHSVIVFVSLTTIALLQVASCTLVSLQRTSNEKLVHYMLSQDILDQCKFNETMARHNGSPPLSNTKTQLGSASWSDTAIVTRLLTSAFPIITLLLYSSLGLLLVALVTLIAVHRRTLKS
jgi:hypothetical protein